jgi:hypothetical protein
MRRMLFESAAMDGRFWHSIAPAFRIPNLVTGPQRTGT